jgi:hypothetical protein
MREDRVFRQVVRWRNNRIADNAPQDAGNGNHRVVGRAQQGGSATFFGGCHRVTQKGKSRQRRLLRLEIGSASEVDLRFGFMSDYKRTPSNCGRADNVRFQAAI